MYEYNCIVIMVSHQKACMLGYMYISVLSVTKNDISSVLLSLIELWISISRYIREQVRTKAGPSTGLCSLTAFTSKLAGSLIYDIRIL